MSRHLVLPLFADDFAAPAAPPVAVAPAAAPPPPPPSYDQAALEAACAEARAAGYEEGKRDTLIAEAAQVSATLATIAERLDDAAARAVAFVDQGVEMLTQLVMVSLLAGYPNLRARFGEDEVRALVRRVMPGLLLEPRVAFHIHPSMIPAVTAELTKIPRNDRLHMTIEPSEEIPPGDMRISWPDGGVVRKTDGAMAAIAEALRPLGLLPDDTGPSAAPGAALADETTPTPADGAAVAEPR